MLKINPFTQRYQASDGTHPKSIAQTKLHRVRISTIQRASLAGDRLLEQFETAVFGPEGYSSLDYVEASSREDALSDHAAMVAKWRRIEEGMGIVRRTVGSARRRTCRRANGRFRRC